MATTERSNIGLQHDKLTVTVTREDYMPAFEKKLKDYSKNANIPGFRKGMVPAGMIRKMYGQGIFSEEVSRTVEKELFAYLEKERPDIFAQPMLLDGERPEADINNPADVTYSFEIGIKPAFTLPDLGSSKLTRYRVDVTDAMIDEEIKRMQAKGGTLKEKAGAAAADDVVKIEYAELGENGEASEGGFKKETEVKISALPEKMQALLIGKNANDAVTFRLNEVAEGEELKQLSQEIGLNETDDAAADKSFKATILSVSETEPRELSPEFFNEVYPGRGINSEAELREALREEMAKYWGSQTRNQLHDQLYHLLLDETQMEFPREFLTRWLQNGGDKPRSAEEAEAEYPSFQNQLKWTLISDMIVRDNNLDVTPEELRTSMKEEVSRYFGQMNMGEDMSWLDSYLDRMMKDEKQVDATYRRMITEKLFNWAEEKITAQEKSITPEELAKLQHHHH